MTTTQWYITNKSWIKKRPYTFSFTISLLTIIIALFYRSANSFNDDFAEMQPIEMIDIMMPKASASNNSELSTDEGSTNVSDQSMGAAENDAVDLSFYPNMTLPRPIGGLPNDYPEIARDSNVEAKVLLQILINKEGIVIQVKIINIKLHKELPRQKRQQIMRAFKQTTISMLKRTRFTPTKINGVKVAIKYETSIMYDLK